MLAFLFLFAFVAVVLLIAALARISDHSSRLRSMEKRLTEAQNRVGALEQTVGKLQEPKIPVRAAARRASRGPVRAVKKSARVSGPAAMPTARPAPPSAGPAPPAVGQVPAYPAAIPTAKRSRTKEEWESLIGGRLLNRIGALALILGVAFFLQYAFTNNWISEPIRVLIGVAIGAALVAGAARSAGRGFQVFAQGLVGAGIAILYLSAYASFNYYRLLSQPVAFLFMSAVTVVTFTQAFRHNSLAVALLGWLGGFLTPFLLSTGEVNTVGLFTYLALLNAGLLLVAWRKDSWAAIEPLAMGATYLIFGLWLGNDYQDSQVVPALLFLVLFWGMYHALHTAHFSREAVAHRPLRIWLAAVNGAVFYCMLYALINIDHPAWRVPATLVAAILYSSFAFAVRPRSGMGGEFLQLLFSGMVLVVIATSIQFHDMPLVQYWSVEALAFVWAGVQWRLRSVWIAGMALFLVCCISLAGTAGALAASPSERFTLLFNTRAFTFALLACAMALSGVLLGRSDHLPTAGMRAYLHVAWCWTLFVLFTVETNDWFAQAIRDAGAARESHLEFLRVLLLPVVWGAWAYVLLRGGIWRRIRGVAVSGLIMLIPAAALALVRGLVYSPISEYSLLFNERVLVLLVVIALCAAARRLLASAAPPLRAPLRFDAPLRAVIALLFLVLLTGEIWDYFAHAIYMLPFAGASIEIDKEMARLQNLRQLFVSAGWLAYSIVLMGIGIWRRVRAVRIEAIVLSGISVLKIFAYDLSFLDTLYRFISFICLGVILLAVSWLYQRYRSVIFGPDGSGGGGASPA